ncbi:MAG: DsbA family protein [Rhodospirillales bacterium]|nr:DsbA family protein [Rhodospirillales bacterium]
MLLLIPVLSPAEAALPPLEMMLADRALGSETAKVTIIEYSSLTCPHCADFHRETLPQIKAAYIDTGQVRYIVRDFPLERRALAAATVARCLPPDRYFGFVDMLFRDQQAWARGDNLLADLKVRAQLAGLSAADFDACISDKGLIDGIQAKAAEGSTKNGINSTPTFLVNGTTLSGALPYDDYRAAIEKALDKAH